MKNKIAFYANNLSERGTAIALYDYAQQNRIALNSESIIFYDKLNPHNNKLVVEKFRREFELFPCDNFNEADRLLMREACDAVYVIKSGKRDELISVNVPTMVHAVFPTSALEVHGSSYAFVSNWLSKICTRGRVPSVPHIVRVGRTTDNMRADLHIPDDAKVFGCYGGHDSFDIAFVRNSVIPKVLDNSSYWFIFMNIEPFIQHPRVLFLPASVDLEIKTAFINTTDAMLHARKRGETFGLAVAEFSMCGKPVFTYGLSRERAHIEMLGDAALTYNGPDDLLRQLRTFDGTARSAQSTYVKLFSPSIVMEQFIQNLIEPAKKFGIDGARRGLGIKPYDPRLLPWWKLKKF
jgi:hypothetical protein